MYMIWLINENTTFFSQYFFSRFQFSCYGIRLFLFFCIHPLPLSSSSFFFVLNSSVLFISDLGSFERCFLLIFSICFYFPLISDDLYPVIFDLWFSARDFSFFDFRQRRLLDLRYLICDRCSVFFDPWFLGRWFDFSI